MGDTTEEQAPVEAVWSVNDFLRLEDEMRNVLASGALAEANKNMYEFFMRVFSEARRAAVDEKSRDVRITISRENWLEGYWSTVRALRFKRRYSVWLKLTKLGLFLVPLWIGHSLHNPSQNYWQVITGTILAAGLFVISQYLEEK